MLGVPKRVLAVQCRVLGGLEGLHSQPVRERSRCQCVTPSCERSHSVLPRSRNHRLFAAPFRSPISQPNGQNGQTATGSPEPPSVGKSAHCRARALHWAPKQAWLCSEGPHIPHPHGFPPPAPLFAFQADAEHREETAPLPTASAQSCWGSGGAERGVGWEHSTVPVSPTAVPGTLSSLSNVLGPRCCHLPAERGFIPVSSRHRRSQG